MADTKAMYKSLQEKYGNSLPQMLLQEYAKTSVSGYTVAAPGALNDLGKLLQQIVLARDWDTLFYLIPLNRWQYSWQLGKYSFRDQNNQRVYIPFSESDIRRWIFSPYYSVEPGYTCPDSQRELGVKALMNAINTHKAKFAPTDWRHLWPIYPGSGYGHQQQFGCEHKTESTWVKIRKPLAIAAGAVAVVTMGPAVLSKIGATLGIGGGAATSAAGAGTSAATGAASGIIGTGAKVAATTAASTATTAATFFSSVKTTANNLLNYYNQGRVIDAIANGKIPPPPISVEGDNFLDWATKVATDQIQQEQQRQVTAQEQQLIEAEMRRLQAQLAAQISPKTPAGPNASLSREVVQVMEKQKEQNRETSELITYGVLGLGLLFMLKG